MNAAAILLAAGSASRMGRLKQLLPYCGKTLIENAADEAIAAGFDPVAAVLGAGSAQVRSLFSSNNRIALVENPAWQTGMGSSLAAGARYVREEAGPDLSAVAVLLADQPLVKSRHLRCMRRAFERAGGSCIIAAEYNGMLGVPAIFPASMLTALEELKPEEGARSLLRNPKQTVEPFNMPEGAFDVDTPDDFARLNDPKA